MSRPEVPFRRGTPRQLILRAPAEAGDAAAWRRLRSDVASTAAELIVCDVDAIAEPDCGTVDALARLQLSARRHGRAVVLRGARQRLCELLELSGLADVIPCIDGTPGAGELGVEPGG